MPRTSGELFQAVHSLRKAVEAELKGNAYYLATQQVVELNELLKGEVNGVLANGSVPRFTDALETVRKRAEAELFDNRFYLFAHKLDVLAFLAAQGKAPPQAVAPVTAPQPAPSQSVALQQASALPQDASPQDSATSKAVPNGAHPVKNAYERNFEELAAASKARVQQNAAALGIVTASPLQDAEAADDGELRRRSSEPCYQRDFETVDPVAATVVSSQAVPAAGIVPASADMGLPAASVGGGTQGHETDRVQAAPQTAEKAVHSAPAKDDRETASASETISEAARRKPLFSLWMDMLFGRSKRK